MTPFEALTREKPDLSNLKVFGCAGYAKVPDALRHKWSPKARKVVFLGLDSEKIGFRILDVNTRRIFVSRNVTFDEKLLPAKKALELLEAKKISENISEKSSDNAVVQENVSKIDSDHLKNDKNEPLDEFSSPNGSTFGTTTRTSSRWGW